MRIPTRLLGAAHNFRTKFYFEAKYGEPAHEPEVNPTNQVKFSLNTTNDLLYAERMIEARRQFKLLLDRIAGVAVELEPFQVLSYAQKIFDFYGQVVSDPRWKVDNISTLHSFHSRMNEVTSGITPDMEEDYHCYRGILPFAEITNFPEFFTAITDFDDEMMYPLYDLLEKDENDPSEEAIFYRTAAITRWWLALHSLKPTAKDTNRIMLEVEKIRSTSKYIGFIDKNSLSKDRVHAKGKASSRVVTQVNIFDVFERWSREREYKHNTMRAWTPIIKNLDVFIGKKNISDINRHDMIRWKDDLLQRQAKTPNNVKNNYLKAASTILGYALQNGLIEEHPLKTPIMKLQKPSVSGLQPYTDIEIGIILNAALERKPNDRFRWLAWVLAATGARVSEITQLGSDQIIQDHGVWAFDIRASEDGATVKNEHSNRRVPIHERLIEDGFLNYALSKSGPIFYKGKKLEIKSKHPSSSVASTHADWLKHLGIRGVNSKGKFPNHSFRRWFSTHQLEIGVQEGVTARIQGHKLPGERERYVGKDLVLTMKAAIDKIDLGRLCSDAEQG